MFMIPVTVPLNSPPTSMGTAHARTDHQFQEEE